MRCELKKDSLFKCVVFPIILWYFLLLFFTLFLSSIYIKLGISYSGEPAVISSGIVSVIIIFIYRKCIVNKKKINKKRICYSLFFTIGLYAALMWILSISGAAGHFSGYENLVNMIRNVPDIIYIICVIILSPICEEVLFRGVLYSYLKKHMKMSYAIILQSILFALSHGNLLQGIYAFVMGIIFALILEYNRNLCSAFLCHITFNFCNDIFELPFLKFLTQDNILLFVFSFLMIFVFLYLMKKDIMNL